MDKYTIIKLNCEGYERYALIKKGEKELWVHFIEFLEYIEDGEISEIKKSGTSITGNLAVDLVNVCEKTDDELSFTQHIVGSSSICAVVRVIKVIDDYNVIAESDFADEPVEVSFEDKKILKEGDVVYIEGSLEFEEL